METDINCFPVGSIVDIDNIPEYQKVTILRVSDSGVTVSGPNCPPNTVISGRSPARRHIEVTKEIKNDIKETETIMKTPNTETASTPSTRGSYVDSMRNLKIPAGQFTIKQLCDLNGIPQPYGLRWVKENCTECGFAPRQPGARGRHSMLYKIQ